MVIQWKPLKFCVFCPHSFNQRFWNPPPDLNSGIYDSEKQAGVTKFLFRTKHFSIYPCLVAVGWLESFVKCEAFWIVTHMAYFICSSFQCPAFETICPAAPVMCGFKPLSKRQKLQAFTQPFSFSKSIPSTFTNLPFNKVAPFASSPFSPPNQKVATSFLDSELNDSLQYVIFDWGEKSRAAPRALTDSQFNGGCRSTFVEAPGKRDINITRDVLTDVEKGFINHLEIWCIDKRSKSHQLLMSDYFGENFWISSCCHSTSQLPHFWTTGGIVGPWILKALSVTSDYMEPNLSKYPGPVRFQVYQNLKHHFWILGTLQPSRRPHKIHWSKRFGGSNTANMKGDSFSSLRLLTPLIKTGLYLECKAELVFPATFCVCPKWKVWCTLVLWVFLFPRKDPSHFRCTEALQKCVRVSWILARPRIWLNKWMNQVAPQGLCLFRWSFLDVWWPCHQKSHCFTRNGGPERYIQHYKNTPFMDHSSWSRQFWQKPKQFYLCSFSRTSDKIGLVDQRWPVCFGRFWRNRGALKFVMKVSQTSGTWWPVDPHIVNGKL